MRIKFSLLVGVIFLLTACASVRANSVKGKYGDFSLENAISIAQSATPNIWSNGLDYQNRKSTIRNAVLEYLKYSSESNKLWLIEGKQWTDVKMGTCYAKVGALAGLMTSGAAERWNRHGAQDVDELHSISENQMFWIGACENGNASGRGVISWLYQGKINTNSTVGYVRAVVYMRDGVPSGIIQAYSNADTCFNVCYARHYEDKFLGSIDDGNLVSDQAIRDVKNQANTANNAMGAFLGGVAIKAAEIIKDGAAANASNSSSNASVNASPSWTVTKQEDGGGLAHWYIKKYYLKCTGGRKSGETLTIHLLKSSGWYQEVFGPARKTFAEAAADGCS